MFEPRRTHARSRGGWAVLVLLGCSSADEDEPVLLERPPVLAGCESEAYAVCDPLAAGCQKQVFAATRCLRGMPDARLPEVREISAAQYRGELLQGLRPDPEAAALRQAQEGGLTLLGLAAPGELSPESVTELLVESVPAYYASDTGVVTLVEGDGGARDEAQHTLSLVHEFAHALQDQEVDLIGLYEATTSLDGFLAAMSLVEGEAEMLESFFAAALWGFGENPDFRTHYTSWVERAEESFAGQSPVLVAQRYVPYAYGARYVYNLYEAGGMQQVRERYGNVPESLLPVLLSEAELAEPAVESLQQLAEPAALEPFELVVADTLGPWVFGKFLERVFSDPSARELMPAWRGDRLLVYATAEAQALAALWTVRFEDVASAERLDAWLADGEKSELLTPSHFHVRRDRDLTIGASSDAALLPEWSASLDLAQQTWGEPPAPTGAEAASPPRLSAGLAAVLARGLLRVSASSAHPAAAGRGESNPPHGR